MLLDAQAITPLSVALPALPEAFIAALLAAIKGCSGQFGKAGSLIHLVSVGGFGHQDLPMSGELQATLHLQTCPPLRDLLGCVIPALGRVCLCQTEGLNRPTRFTAMMLIRCFIRQTTFLWAMAGNCWRAALAPRSGLSWVCRSRWMRLGCTTIRASCSSGSCETNIRPTNCPVWIDRIENGQFR